jgi:hypothetical protein
MEIAGMKAVSNNPSQITQEHLVASAISGVRFSHQGNKNAA